MGTYLSVGGLWRVTAVSVGRARASNLLKFLAAGSRRHKAGAQLSELFAPNLPLALTDQRSDLLRVQSPVVRHRSNVSFIGDYVRGASIFGSPILCD